MANFPTLSRVPSYPLDPDGELEDVVIRSPQTGGYNQTRPRTTRARRNFGVNYKALKDVDVNLLRTFETTTLRNGADSFTWTHPLSGTTYTVQIIGGIKYSRKQPPGVVDVMFKLMEV